MSKEQFDLQSDMGGTFPFQSHRLEIDGHEIAYIDEGPKHAPVLLMLHGNPTWSYLYRHFIREYSKKFRCIVPDHIGFGRSSKPETLEYYSLKKHISNLSTLVNHLNLQQVIPVGQDWGGPIGLGWATSNKNRVLGLIILNTWAFVRITRLKMPLIFKLLFRTKVIGNFVSIRRNMFVNNLIPLGIYNKEKIRPDFKTMIKAYRAPFSEKRTRKGIYAFPRMIPTNPSHPEYPTMLEIEKNLINWDIPALVFTATQDRVFNRAIAETFHQILPNSNNPIPLLAGHFCQEEAMDEICFEMNKFFQKLTI